MMSRAVISLHHLLLLRDKLIRLLRNHSPHRVISKTATHYWIVELSALQLLMVLVL